ncbi:MAG: hypothetical protein GDA56_20400 [Hormoscilla sp. GM7CHS1pb]|nr:hypothetical protein [Hormoscilla sp. GM7CHS1pb]
MSRKDLVYNIETYSVPYAARMRGEALTSDDRSQVEPVEPGNERGSGRSHFEAKQNIEA